MTADIDLQAWLETDAASHPPIVTPYIRSLEDQVVGYDLLILKVGRGSSARVARHGDIAVQAGRAAMLGRFSVSVNEGDTCRIELVLRPRHSKDHAYHFECPP